MDSTTIFLHPTPIQRLITQFRNVPHRRNSLWHPLTHLQRQRLYRPLLTHCPDFFGVGGGLSEIEISAFLISIKSIKICKYFLTSFKIQKTIKLSHNIRNSFSWFFIVEVIFVLKQLFSFTGQLYQKIFSLEQRFSFHRRNCKVKFLYFSN